VIFEKGNASGPPLRKLTSFEKRRNLPKYTNTNENTDNLENVSVFKKKVVLKAI
jgi:hypothetical protein